LRNLQTVIAADAAGDSATFSLEGGWTLRLVALEPWHLRVVLAPNSGLPDSRTWMVAPEGETPWEGRDREDRSGFSCPPLRLDGAGPWIVSAGDWRVVVASDPVRMNVERRHADGTFVRVRTDRESGAYVLAERGAKLRHCVRRDLADRIFGLGDKTGPVDRTGRRFRLLQLDALGYDAEIGDPLYKHVPFWIERNAAGESIGVFHDTLTPMTVDFGCERSNYHGLYRYAEMEEPGLDLHLLAGPTVADVVRRFTTLTGRPHLGPRWSFGFAFTSMHHADDPQAQTKIAEFADRCRAERIPISSIHFGSGYSSRGKRRYVFTWNRDKFPDPAALFAKLRAIELPTVANLKPVLIDDHPDFAEIAAAGGFIKGPEGAPVLEQFWDGHGAFLDFTNPATVRWWQDRLAKQVLDPGFTAGWNDNNEYEVWREGATSTGFGTPMPAERSRPLHALLMTRATFERTRAREPDKRPFTVTRAGPPGIQRYAQTWTGDNDTSWHTLRWNIRNALSLSLSGMAHVGHDIGGFSGPRPDPELLTRFVELMALHPRALMNSWKPSYGVTEPWTHPEAVDDIRSALVQRYRFLPLLYTLAHRAQRTGDPIIAPLFWAYEDDAETFEDHDAFLLGSDVLVAPVVEPGARAKTVYLPAGPEAWVDLATGIAHPAGSTVTVPAPLGRVPAFARVGAALMLARGLPETRPHDAPARNLLVVVGAGGGEGGGEHIDDDGESNAYRAGAFLHLGVATAWEAASVRVRLTRLGGDWPIPDDIAITVLGGGDRTVEVEITP
jgi:alpha-glucosidase